MNPDDLIAAFNELDDAETRIDRTKLGDEETVRLVPSWNKAAVRRFKALAVDAAALFDPAGQGDPETRWLRFVLDHAPELVEDRYAGHPARLNVFDRRDDGTKWRVPFIAQDLPDAARASALVVRRCRPLIEKGEQIERVQAGVADALARADVDTPTPPVDPHAGELGTMAESSPTSEPIVDDAYLSPNRLAESFRVPAEALRKRLDRWRETHHEGWIENTERKPREAQYLYQVSAVRPVVDALRVSSQASSERPANKP